MALFGDRVQGLNVRPEHSQEFEHQVRRALALPLCLFHLGQHDVLPVHPRGIAEDETSCGERALDRRYVHLREWCRNNRLIRGTTVRRISAIS